MNKIKTWHLSSNPSKCAVLVYGVMLKENYRPVSVLPALSKIFEGVLVDQLSEYFKQHLSPYVSGFRKGHDCQSVLIRFNESVKRHLIDNGEAAGALLTDLSKAFDCLPHDDRLASVKNVCVLT